MNVPDWQRSNLAPQLSWSDFVTWALSKVEDTRLIFRGQSATYPLTTTFHRAGRRDMVRYWNDDVPHLKRTALPTLALLGLVLTWATPPQKAAAAGAENRFQTVIAKKFVLVDEDGAARATLNVDNPSLGLCLWLGTQGGFEIDGCASSNVAFLHLDRGGPMAKQNTKRIVTLKSEEDGPSVEVFDGRGYTGILGATYMQNPRTGESSTSSAASLHLFGKDGKVIWSAPR